MVLIFAFVLFGLYLLFSLWKSIILSPASKVKAQSTGSPHITPNDLEIMYQTNKPMILRHLKLLELFVKHPGPIYFASVMLLLIDQWHNISIFFWVLVAVSSIATFFFIEFIITLIATMIFSVMEKSRND